MRNKELIDEIRAKLLLLKTDIDDCEESLNMIANALEELASADINEWGEAYD